MESEFIKIKNEPVDCEFECVESSLDWTQSHNKQSLKIEEVYIVPNISSEDLDFRTMERKIKDKMSHKAIEDRRKRKRENEQRRRDKIRQDPELHGEAKRKERDRYYKRKEEGKIKSIKELSNFEKRQQRKYWKHRSKQYRERKKLTQS